MQGPFKISPLRGNAPLIYASFLLFALIVLLPVYWLLRSSIAVPADLIRIPLVYFPTPTLRNFQTLIEHVPFFDYVRNSLPFPPSPPPPPPPRSKSSELP